MKYVYQQSAFVSDGVGLALAPFAQFTVTNASDGSPASLWNDKNGESSIDDNVVLADENGFVRFYVDAGSYNISILSGSVELTLYNVDIVEDATSEIATAISQHSSASDPHGDRAFAVTVANDAEVAAKAYADLILASAINLRGGYDASSNTWPTTGGSGSGGAIKAGNLWFVSVPGTLGGKPVVVGDSFFAVVDNPGQTNANYCVLDTNLGFVPETAGAAAAAIAAHLAAADPHGDRAYALSLITAHLSATDPHGDRAYTDSAIAAIKGVRLNGQTGSYTVQAADGDDRTYIRQTSSGSTNLYIPDDTTNIPVNRLVMFGNAGTGTATIVAANGSVTLNYASGALTVGPGERRGLLKVGANAWDVV